MDQIKKNVVFILFCWLLPGLSAAKPPPPHIIFIMADDLGWNDVGFHGSTQIPTPNIDALAYSGVILNNYYMQAICTPSRGALMTGKYPIHTGLQLSTIYASHPWGLGLDEKILPEHLSPLGYVSHLVGKWHLGFFKKEYTPTYRGFQSHFGFWTGRIDYYDHSSFERGHLGFDMKRNMSSARDISVRYATDLFTEEATNIINVHNASSPLFLFLSHLAVHSGNPNAPLQAPEEIINKFLHIKDESRRKYAGMLWKLDESVGAVVKALQKNNMLENSIIIFTTDNGGPADGFNDNAASNWPLRGVKATLWEGGIRGAGLIWSPLLKKPGRVYNSLMHITDLLPTLITAAGGNSGALGQIDGKDMWKSLVNDQPSTRTEFPINIDPKFKSSGIRAGDWKLVYRPLSWVSFRWDSWIGPTGRNETAEATKLENIFRQILESPAAAAVKTVIPKAFRNLAEIRKYAEVSCGPVPPEPALHCIDPSTPCLFHIPSDPCEYHDLAEVYPDIVRELHSRLQSYNATAVPPRNKPTDEAADPKYWDSAWTNWKDYPLPLPLRPHGISITGLQQNIVQ
ncbi:arylsulfatase B-like [Oratosquilla oratoria]|uniref:arylsulfatase B-like n=1 Tax=Oratosquilla oratoria TaxID=337810 RepID=UPI003F75BE1C